MMNEPVDMVTLVRDLPSRPRGRACIVLTHEYGGQKEWVAELARQTDSEHLDLLELFAQDTKLSSKIGQFSVPFLFEFLRKTDKETNNSSFRLHHSSFKNAPVLVISGMEFLKATWAGQSNAVDQFLSQLKTWDKYPSLLFVMQYDKTIAFYDFGRRYQYTFVVDQKETLAL
jgi:hypothetical protein